MDLRLEQIKIKNFKGIKAFEFKPDCQNAIITGENGQGKTSVYDAFLWLLFGKDSDGKKQFEVRPLTVDNKRNNGVDVEVEAVVHIDWDGDGGYNRVFKKIEEAKTVKGQFKGYTSKYWVDEVPKKAGEYADAISEIVNEESFRMLTDLRYFCEIPWQERRTVLMSLCPDMEKPKGFDGLLSNLKKDMEIDEYRDILRERKKLYAKEQQGIPPRIDELNMTLPACASIDEAKLERVEIQNRLKEIESQREKVSKSETKRQEKLRLLAEIVRKRDQREAECKSDTTAVQAYIKERNDLQSLLADKERAVNKAKADLANLTCPDYSSQIEELRNRLAEKKAEFMAAKNSDNKCPQCGYELDGGATAKKIEALKAEAMEIKTKLSDMKAKDEKITALYDQEKAELEEALERLTSEYRAMKGKTENRIAGLNAKIESGAGIDHEKDELWLTLCNQAMAVEIPESAIDKLSRLNQQYNELNSRLIELNQQLALKDKAAEIKKRIKELEARESELAQSLADIEADLAEIQRFKDAESRAVENAVNGMFTYIQFKLFETQINGETKDCCTPMLNGVPYADMSYGQKVLCGVDCINTFSEIEDTYVPLFVDNAESLTIPIETKTQMIKLVAVKGQKLAAAKTEIRRLPDQGEQK